VGVFTGAATRVNYTEWDSKGHRDGRPPSITGQKKGKSKGGDAGFRTKREAGQGERGGEGGLLGMRVSRSREERERPRGEILKKETVPKTRGVGDPLFSKRKVHKPDGQKAIGKVLATKKPEDEEKGIENNG